MAKSPSLLDDGLAAHDAGDIHAARAKFAEAVKRDPNDPEALHLLGLTCEMQKERAEAIKLIERAVAIDPREPLFRMNLAAIFEKERRFDEAVNHLNEALKIKPSASDIWALLGDIEKARLRTTEAIGAYRHAINLDNRNVDALAGYGRAKLLEGDIEEAKRASAAANRLASTSIPALTLALHIARTAHDGRGINQIALTWKKTYVGDRDSLHKLANILFEFGYWKEARAALTDIVWREPINPEILITYGRICTAAREYKEADSVFEKAIVFNPNDADCLYGISRLKFYMGDMKDAESLTLQAIANNSKLYAAFNQLCEIRKDKMDPEHLTIMKIASEDPSTDLEDAYKLRIAIGNVHHARKETAEAFSQFTAGNKIGEENLIRNHCAYNSRDYSAQTDRIMSLFSTATPSSEYDRNQCSPIFVVGTPRSGTTLAESILSAPSEVFGAGELGALPTILRDVLSWAQKDNAQEFSESSPQQRKYWREWYYSKCPAPVGARYFVDKQPLNFRAIGLIRYILPEAKIVHMRRNPIDTGFSIFRQPFMREWPFTYNLADIAHFYGEYARLMTHWEKVYQGDFLTVQYESLLENFEEITKEVYRRCALQWTDSVLEFHKIKRPIATFSAAQVRQPLKKSPERAAKRYIEYLSPLIDGLTAANVDLETGALRP